MVRCLYGEQQTVDRTLDRYTMADLIERMVSTMTGSPPEIAQDRTQTKGHTSSSRIEIKISDLAGNRTWTAGLEGRESIDHDTPTDH